jgi:hypothetical protein
VEGEWGEPMRETPKTRKVAWLVGGLIGLVVLAAGITLGSILLRHGSETTPINPASIGDVAGSSVSSPTGTKYNDLLQVVTNIPESTKIPTVIFISTPTPTISKSIPTPSIPLYDDFKQDSLETGRWGTPVWGNPISYTPTITSDGLKFNLIKDMWFDWMITDSRYVREFYVLVTLANNGDNNRGWGAAGFTIGNMIFRYGLFIKNNILEITNIDNDLQLIDIGGTCCPVTHIIGAKADQYNIYLYLDGNPIARYPMEGYPNVVGLQVMSGNGELVAYYHSVWVDFINP